MTLVNMHGQANLISLDQRRQVQLLNLMYIYRNFVNVQREFARNTRQGERYNFRVDNYQSSKYKNSPYFKGTILWDSLPNDVINMPTLLEFKRAVRNRFSPFNGNLSY